MSESGGSLAVGLSKKGFADLTAKSFKAKVRGRVFQGFVVRQGDKFYAYQNLCRHLAITLDLNDDDFFTHDKKFLQCQMHGAMYEINTGLCIGGPCLGAQLMRLELEEEEDRLVIRIPKNASEK